jgi:hypothetical protein
MNRLAAGAEVAATVADGDALNGGATNRAGLITPVGNLKLKMGCPRFAIRTKISRYASPLISDG